MDVYAKEKSFTRVYTLERYRHSIQIVFKIR